MRRTLCALALTLSLCGGLAVPALAAGYTDVPAGSWYAEAVEKVTAEGVMNGTTGTTFDPDSFVTRGMVMAVLWRLAGSPVPEGASDFSDLQAWYYYADAVAWGQEQGIATGLGDGRFGGGDTVTREQLAVFLYRYALATGGEVAAGVLDPYEDAGTVHAWALEGMAHAVGAGLITGDSDGNLSPAGNATRAQLAIILQRLMTPAVG